jgi:hypothetical protein
MIIEQIIVITPVAPVNPLALVIEFALMIILVVLVFRTRNSFMPQYVGRPAGAGAHDEKPGDLATAHHR